jgi:two-component system, NarL family, invasion response regulator UvrY
MPRILIVDDHPVVREGLGRVLTAAFPGVVLGEAEDSAQALQAVHQHVWDLVILDLALPGDDGNVALRRLHHAYPSLPVLIISMHPADQFARRSVQAGAAGYVSKGSDPSELVRAVKTALAGGRYLPAQTEPPAGPARSGDLPHETLSDREYQVLRMIGQGRTVSEIATELSLSVKTISTYRARILEKTGMRTNAELMRYVITHRLAPWPPA